MSKSGNKNTITTEQVYTAKDVKNFDLLMHFPQSVNHPKRKAESEDMPNLQNNNFDFTEFDDNQFKKLAAELTRIHKPGGANSPFTQNRRGPDGYTDSDKQLFETLLPGPYGSTTQTKQQNRTGQPSPDDHSEDQQYTARDLEQFRSITYDNNDQDNNLNPGSILERSPNDRDVGKIKIREFNNPGSSVETHKESNNPKFEAKIKVKYFG